MTESIIVGFCGLAGAGKSTCAKILSREAGYVRRPFAYPLKAMVAALGIPPEVLDGPSAIKEQPSELFGGKSVREALQTLGTEWGRAQFGTDFWLNMWRHGASGLPRVVVEDVRFPNEAAAIADAGGYLIRVERPGSGSTVGAGHASERVDDLAPFVTHVLHNGGSVDDVRLQLRLVLGPLAEPVETADGQAWFRWGAGAAGDAAAVRQR